MPTAYTQRFHVRFDECAGDSTARASTLLRYVIETAFGHSTREGFPLTWYEAHGLYWLVRYAHLALHRPAPYGAVLDVTTEVVGFRRIWARRNNAIQDQTGHILGEFIIDWIFTDREGNPARIVPEMEAAFPGLTDHLEVTHLDLGEPPAGLQADAYLVPAHEADPRGHMNNAAYLDLFEDALSVQGVDPQVRPAVYEVEYLRAVRPGEILRRFIWQEPDAWALSVRTGGDRPVVRALRR